MSSTRLIAARHAAATRLGMSHAEYDAHIAAGEKWCSGCRRWQPLAQFGSQGSYCRYGAIARHRRRWQRMTDDEWNYRLARVLAK